MTSLTKEDVSRYSRQLILPELGVKGQVKLRDSSVLIVGGGGLGCPAGLYLASAGIGRIGVVDYDTLDTSNLHRQVVYKEEHVGSDKAHSFASMLRGLNSVIECVAHSLLLNSSNALDVIREYDVVIDATDNVSSRYLLNDACVLLGKPLVSGSALRWEGQLTTYNYKGGPCYRCLFPTPPPPETVTNCSDGGVLGVIPGIIGSMQALEVIKILTGMEPSYSQKLLLFDGLTCQFRTIKLRPKQSDCLLCSDNASIIELVDYTQFCGSAPTDRTVNIKVSTDDERLTCSEYNNVVKSCLPHILVDVRSPIENEICNLPQSINIPFEILEQQEKLNEIKELLCKVDTGTEKRHLFIVCRRGNNSQLAVQILKKQLQEVDVVIKDLKGGLLSWAEEVDPNFPVY